MDVQDEAKFEQDRADGATGAALASGDLVVDLGAYEGPLDVLLALARDQKVDLRRISILKLAEQYLLFIAEARKLKLELAADYLVMAAWLAYLKSRLLLPEPEQEGEPSGEELAARLQLQLRRLEAMREVSDLLQRRNQVGLNLFARGAPEGVRIIRKSIYECALFDLLKVYGDFRASRGSAEVLPMRLARRRVISVEEAFERLRGLVGDVPEWTVLYSFLPPDLADPFTYRSAIASHFNASLEMAKQGMIDIRQAQQFGPIFIRKGTPREIPQEPTTLEAE